MSWVEFPFFLSYFITSVTFFSLGVPYIVGSKIYFLFQFTKSNETNTRKELFTYSVPSMKNSSLSSLKL